MSIVVDAAYPSVASMVVSSEYDVDSDLKYIRITNTLDDSFVNIDPNIEICQLVDAIVDTEHEDD